MSLKMVAASTQYLTQSAPPLLDYPFNIGLWMNLSAVSNVARTLFCLTDTGAASHFLSIGMTSAELLRISAAAGGTVNSGTATTALVAETWNFSVFRFVASNQRRFRPVYANGFSGEVGSTATARAPTNMDAILLGALNSGGTISEPWDGMLAEYWIMKGDIMDGVETTDAYSWLMRELRMRGPFALPHIARKVVEYRSFRTGINGGGPDDIYFAQPGVGSGAGSPTRPGPWTDNNGVTIGPHPPHVAGWVKASQWRRTLMI